MNNSAISPREALDAAIANDNPFVNAGIVKEQDIWEQEFLDVPTLNARVSDMVFQAIDLVRNSEQSKDKVTSILITAQYGTGKTHVLRRIHRKIQRDGNAFFIYCGGNNYTDVNLIDYQTQQILIDSLSKIGSQEVMQLQEVAAAMANEGFKNISANAPNLSPQALLEKFDKVHRTWSANKRDLLDKLTKEVLKSKPNTDPYLVRAILWTLSQSQAYFALKWLSGDELAASDADALGLPNLGKTNQEKEAQALKNIQQILKLVCDYKPVFICFDEVEALNDANEAGFRTPQIIAALVKRLHDTLEQSELSQGVVMFTVMFPDTWSSQIEGFLGGTKDRISKYTNGKPIELDYVNGNSMVELVTVWLQDFYESKNLKPHDPLYPFQDAELRKFGQQAKPTVREALRWCAEKFKLQETLPSDPFERFKLALDREKQAERKNYLEDNSLIGYALRFAFQALKGQIIEGETATGEKLNKVIIENVVDVEPKSKNQGWINFKIVGQERGKEFKIGVTVLQYANLGSVYAGMWRLIEYELFDFTRGCLVRSKSKKIRKNTDSYKYLNKLVEELGGEWIDLKDEEIRPLIDLYSLYQKCKYYQLTPEQIQEFARDSILNNPLLLEILSDPSGQIDPETIEREELLDAFFSDSQTNETDDFNDLSDLLN
ncbi:MAG TPA: ATP-binding protein [Nostocaceae cyanobacterium]|nr:ATP-binding protein [Nostocaceae cyanobacterium]